MGQPQRCSAFRPRGVPTNGGHATRQGIQYHKHPPRGHVLLLHPLPQ